MNDLELVEARWRAGHILTSELTRVAGELRAAGHDVPALSELARTPSSELRTSGRKTFERALRELGHGGMNGRDAAMLLARRWASLMLEGTISPRQAAKAIARLRFKAGAELDEHLLPFEALDAEYDQVRQRRLRGRFTPRLDRATRAAARRLAD